MEARKAFIEKKMLSGTLSPTTNLFKSTNIATCLLCIGNAESSVVVDCAKKKESAGKKWTYSDEQIAEIAGFINERKESEIQKVMISWTERFSQRFLI